MIKKILIFFRGRIRIFFICSRGIHCVYRGIHEASGGYGSGRGNVFSEADLKADGVVFFS